MKFRKRYAALVLSAGLIATCQMEFLAFRKSEEAQRKYLQKRGQEQVDFNAYTVDGRRIHYVHTGADTLPLVLLVHGAPGSSGGMLDYLSNEEMTSVAQVAAIDRPGYGYSDFGKAERSLERQAAALRPLLEKYGQEGGLLPKPILVGHSFGGPVIARVAMDYPELVGGLVIVAGSIDPDLEPRDWWPQALDWPLVRWMLPPAARVCNQEILPLRRELEKMLPLWEKISCPVTVIQGMKDKLVHPANVAFAGKMLTNSPRLEIDTLEHDGHFILWTQKDHVVKKVLEMLHWLNNSTL